ncbi:hypothetical protein ACROYT_G034941 [Oculina patagonica]
MSKYSIVNGHCECIQYVQNIPVLPARYKALGLPLTTHDHRFPEQHSTRTKMRILSCFILVLLPRAVPAAFKVGARVFARWTNGLYYCGFVVNAADSRLYIHFDDGDNLDYSESEAEQALVLDVLPSSTQLQPNTRVIGAGPESHRYNPGVIEKVQDPEPGSSSKLSSYYVKFDNEDGSNEFFYQIRVM